MTATSNFGDLLASSRVFAGLGEAHRRRLTAGAQVVRLQAGERLFAHGDQADAMFVVATGRLEALDPSTGEPMRSLGRGDVVGELALLTAGTRSTTVVARRDSALVEIQRAAFEQAVAAEPALARDLLAAVAEQLRVSAPATSAPSGLPATVLLLGVGDDAPLPEAAELLGAALREAGTVARLDGPLADAAAAAERLDRAERDHDQVLLVAAADDQAWTAFCLRQADRTVTFTGGTSPPPGGLPAGLRGGYLLAAGAPPSAADLDRWRSVLDPVGVIAGPGTDLGARIAVLGRRLTRRSVGVVLSGGGARGFAHIGALDALLREGVVIDRVGGCSMGALTGALLACGHDPDEIELVCRREFVEANPVRDYTIPLAALIRGHRARDMLQRLFGERVIETLERDYFCVSADLIPGELVVHRSGPVYRAVGASISIPGVAPPVAEGDRLLVDGGVLDNLPVRTMAATDEGPVLAVDVTSAFNPAPVGPSRGRPGAVRLQRWARSVVVGNASGASQPPPNLRETIMRAATLGAADSVIGARARADLVITPDLAGIGLLDFGRIGETRERGRIAAEAALAGGMLGT